MENTINEYKPEVIVVNAGDNQFNQGGSLVMDADDVYNTAKIAPNSKLLQHIWKLLIIGCYLEDLRHFSQKHQFDTQLLIPNDGDRYQF